MFRESDPSDADIILCEKLILDLGKYPQSYRSKPSTYL